MNLTREHIVTNLIPKDQLISEVPLDFASVMEKFNKAFDKQVKFDVCRGDTSGELMVDPFEELREPDNIADTKNKGGNRNIKNKWGLMDLTTFSPKYMMALDGIQQEATNDSTQTEDSCEGTSSEPVGLSLIDDEWRLSIRNYIEEECKVDIRWPDGFLDGEKTGDFQHLVRKVKLKKLLESKPQLNEARKLQDTKIAKVLKKKESEAIIIPPEYKELLNTINGKLLSSSDEVFEPATWKETEVMRIKCEDWLTHRFDQSQLVKKIKHKVK